MNTDNEGDQPVRSAPLMSGADVPQSNAPAIRSLTKERGFPRLSTINDLLTRFSPSERLVLYILTLCLGVSALALVAGANAIVSVNIPSQGGSITEGLVGPARFINPVLATSAADNDLTALIFSGLTRSHPDRAAIPDLAQSYEISEDGTTYTFTLRDDARFHDGNPVTSADVLYTVKQIQNPEVKSPHRADWEGVQISTPDDRTVVFKLPHAYAPFLENTSIGILPEHLWKNTVPEDFAFNPLNTNPVGSGPYEIASVEKDTTGSAIRFELHPFSRFALGRPHLNRITFRLYPNEEAVIDAFNRGDVDSVAGISSTELARLELHDSMIVRATMPRVFAVFLNQNHAPVLSDAVVRRALDSAIDRDRLIRATLGGFAIPLTSPVPERKTSYAAATSSTTTVSTAYTLESVENARSILRQGGWSWSEQTGEWKKGGRTLAFTLSTSDTPELQATANAVAAAWRQAGVKVDVHVYPLSELNTTVIRPREYDAILFGEVVGREPDLYAFWHSSQRNDPGLNLSLYANAKADTLLSQARATTKKEDRDKLYEEFAALLKEDRPAIFLYAPDFLYVFPKNLTGVRLGALSGPSDRYLNVYQWYTDTEHVWEIFARDTDQTL